MKKFVAFVAAMVATLAMTTSVFAANSPTTVSSATAGVSVSSAVDTQFVEKVSTPDALKAVLGNTYTSTSQVLATIEVEGTLPADGMVTLNVAGIQAGDSVVLIHWINGDPSNVEILNATTGNGTVTAKFSSLSPVAVVRLAPVGNAGTTAATTTTTATATATATTAAATSADSNTAPQTGEAGVTAAMIMALACAAGVVVLNRKKVLSK